MYHRVVWTTIPHSGCEIDVLITECRSNSGDRYRSKYSCWFREMVYANDDLGVNWYHKHTIPQVERKERASCERNVCVDWYHKQSIRGNQTIQVATTTTEFLIMIPKLILIAECLVTPRNYHRFRQMAAAHDLGGKLVPQAYHSVI